jgi:hypothetical protein
MLPRTRIVNIMLKAKYFYLAYFDHHHHEQNQLYKEVNVQVLLLYTNFYYDISQETHDKLEYRVIPVTGRGGL